MRQIFLEKKSINIISVLLFILLSLISEYMYSLELQHRMDQSKQEFVSQAGSLRAALEREVHTTLNLCMGLVVFVATQPDFNDEQFAAIAATLMRSAPHLRNIGLAKGNVISHIYPLKGNEAAIGLHYLENAKQRDAVLRAIATRKTVIAGPVDLVQGGQAFIGRIPIFTGPDYNTYWGVASIVIDLDPFYTAAGLHATERSFQIALRGKDATGMHGPVFYGDPEIFTSPDAIILPVKLPVGQWILAMKARQNGLHAFGLPEVFRIFGYLAALSISLLLYTLLNAIRRNRFLALHDPLTGLANRRLFNEMLTYAIDTTQRRESTFALLYIDLDNFKPINDTYGHDSGDIVLEAVAQRLSRVSRNADQIARIGGDEFVLILHDIGSLENTRMVADKLADTIRDTIVISEFITVHMECSIGISIYPGDGQTADELITHADSVMYHAKSAKGAKFPRSPQ